MGREATERGSQKLIIINTFLVVVYTLINANQILGNIINVEDILRPVLTELET